MIVVGQVTYLHLLKDSGAIISDNHISIWTIIRKTKLNKMKKELEMSSYLTSILSIPFGPRDVFMRLATVRAAMMLIY